MMGSLRVNQILSKIADGSTPTADLPQRLVEDCAWSLPVSGVGLGLMTDAGPGGTVAATDGPARLLAELQFTMGEGPCLDSARTGRPVLHPDLATTGPRRWPGFSAGALEAGICAIFSFPLCVGRIRVGVLDLYRDRSGMLTGDELGEALSFADAATTVLLHLQSQLPKAALGAIAVIDDRAEVHQATGVLSVQAGVSLADALLLLRAHAFAADRPIRSLARDVLDGVARMDIDNYDIGR